MSNFNIPFASWRLPVFLEATPEELQAKIVDCGTCPVQRQCVAGQGGTGWTCPKCNATGVYIDAPPDMWVLPKDVFVVDCGQHNFHLRKEARYIPACALCNGGQMELLAIQETSGPRFTEVHYIATKYAKVPVAERQEALKRDYAKFKEQYSKKGK